MSSKPNVTYTDRGFKHLDPLVCDYGTQIRVYESSSAEAPHIWLALEQGHDPRKSNLAKSEAHAHLPLETAEQLRDQLSWMIDNHYQVEPSTPELTYDGRPIEPDRPYHTFYDTPQVGDDIYLPTALYLSHGADDFIGGLARVRRVGPGMSAGEYVPFVEVAERPGTYYNWRHLREEQEKLRTKFGDNRSYPDPDLRPEFNRWD